MVTQVINAGDITMLSINNVEFPVVSDTECEIVFTHGDKDATSSEATPCTNNTIILYKKIQNAGIYGITIALREDLIPIFAELRDSNNPDGFLTILTLTSGISFTGSLRIVGEPKMKSKDHTTQIDLLGKRFAKM